MCRRSSIARVTAAGLKSESGDDPASAQARNDSSARPSLIALTTPSMASAPTAVDTASFTAAPRRPASSNPSVAAAGA